MRSSIRELLFGVCRGCNFRDRTRLPKDNQTLDYIRYLACITCNTGYLIGNVTFKGVFNFGSLVGGHDLFVELY